MFDVATSLSVPTGGNVQVIRDGDTFTLLLTAPGDELVLHLDPALAELLQASLARHLTDRLVVAQERGGAAAQIDKSAVPTGTDPLAI